MPPPSPPRPAPRAAASGPPSSLQTGSGPRAKGEQKQTATFFLGRYRVVDELGIGGMASVHLARMDGPGGFQKWVAIKRIHPHLVEDDQFVDMFLDEARIAAGINHANVAQVFDLGKDDNTYWIAMEYLHGEPLREIMRRSFELRMLISPELAMRICADAAEGLHAAHELRGKNGQLLGLVHRDVTPHNLFITYDGYTKVVDFGIAKVADRLSSTRAGTLKGKLAYMSPEQVRGAEVDRTTDVFALGVVLWELTTGHRLFRMDTDLDTLEKVQACVVPPPSSIVPNYPAELENVVLKALAKRKADRFQTAREFSRALQGVLMRRGSFVGPEEISGFVHQVFGDRIQKREAHLAWAAEVTSTIDVEELRPGQERAPAVRPLAARHSEADQPSAEPKAPPASSLQALRAPPPNAPTHFTPPPPMPPQMSASSLMDDDEDVATTVATREHLEAAVMQFAPSPATGGSLRPAAGAPAAVPPAGGVPAAATQAGRLPGAGMPAAQTPAAGMGGAQGHPGQGQKAPSFPPSRRDHEYTAAFPSGARDLASTVAFPQDMSAPPQRLADIERARQQQAPYGGQGQPHPGYNGYAQQPSYQMAAPPAVPAMHPQPPPAQSARPGMGPSRLPQFPLETAASAHRPDAGSLWLAHQEAVGTQRPKKSTGLLVAVWLLTASCVSGIGALVYLKLRAAPAPTMIVAPVTPNPAQAGAEATPPTGGSAAMEAPSPSDSAAAGAAPSASAAQPTPTAKPSSAAAVQPPASGGATNAAPKDTSSEAEEPGFLTIVCTPFCEEVSDGSHDLGASPIVHIATKPGQHRITLKRSGVPSKVISLVVVSGQVTAQRVSMK